MQMGDTKQDIYVVWKAKSHIRVGVKEAHARGWPQNGTTDGTVIPSVS